MEVLLFWQLVFLYITGDDYARSVGRQLELLNRPGIEAKKEEMEGE